MMLKEVIFCICATLLLKVDSLSLASREDSSEEQKKDILESLKEFVDVVDKYNLNVTVIGSKRNFWSTGEIKEDLSLTLHMPVNEEHLSVPTLTDGKQSEYVKELTNLAKKEHVGVKTRVIKIKDGEDKESSVAKLNEPKLINSLGYDTLTNFKNGVRGFSYPENETSAILLNYLIKDADEKIKRMEVMTTTILINDLEVSEGFPTEVREESKKLLTKLWMAAEYESIIAELLVEHLDKKFKNNHQVVIGVEEFDLGEKKFAKMEIGDTNVLIFIL